MLMYSVCIVDTIFNKPVSLQIVVRPLHCRDHAHESPCRGLLLLIRLHQHWLALRGCLLRGLRVWYRGVPRITDGALGRLILTLNLPLTLALTLNLTLNLKLALTQTLLYWYIHKSGRSCCHLLKELASRGIVARDDL